jgi:hypothetical protein
VARALVSLHQKRADQLATSQDAGARQRLSRKLKLIQSRAARYDRAAFSR